MEDAREYLLRIPTFAGKKHSLSEAGAFFEELQCPFPGAVVHVAGTNGKGSVCAFLSSILRASGFHVGTFTSPHLTDIRERICLDGEMIDETAFQRSFEQVFSVWKQMEERGMTHPTFFEYLFYMAAVWFQEVKPDVVILETGMGGRRDVTNLCRPDLSVITSISLDHMAYLGNTVEEIAAEKAGIIKAGVPLVFDGNDSRAADVIRREAESAGVLFQDVREEKPSVSWAGSFPEIGTFFEGVPVKAVLPFPAQYQVWNGVLAVRATEFLQRKMGWRENGPRQENPASPGHRVSAVSVERGLERARHAGRMEEVLPGVFFDGAHNRDGIRAFAQAAARIAEERKRPVHLLFSAVSDKEYRAMAVTLAADLKPVRITVAGMESSRGLSTEAMKEAFRAAGYEAESRDSAEEAFACAMKERGGDLLFAVGSLYFIGELKKCLREENI